MINERRMYHWKSK